MSISCSQQITRFYRRIENRLIQISRLLGNVDIDIFVECEGDSCEFQSPLQIPRGLPVARKRRINHLIREVKILIRELLSFIGFEVVRINCSRESTETRFRCNFTLQPTFNPNI